MARNISLEPIESYPIRKTLDGYSDEYSSVDKFKQQLTAHMLSEKHRWGWVFRTEYSSCDESNRVESSEDFRESVTEKITHALRNIASKSSLCPENILIQFWKRVEVGGRCRLTTLHQPFAVSHLSNGLSWLRKKCMQSYYIVDDAADVDQLGPLGRVFRNGNPESSPDILLYSTKEFPLRDLVIGCCLKSYLALPIFDEHHNQCVGVLEFIFRERVIYLLEYHYPEVDDALQVVGLRSAHKYSSPCENLQSQPQPLREIRDMLNLAIKSIPQLHLAQVWLPCNQCATNSCCMERKIFISRIDELEDISDEITSEFVSACGFHNIQNGQGIVGLLLSSTNKSCFCKNLSEFSITEYPMTHYARRARFSSCFAICPRNKHNGNGICVFEFFLQPQSRDDASIQSILHSLLKLMEEKLKSFEISTERYFGTEYQPLEEHMLAIPMNKYEETFSVLEFKEFFQKVDLLEENYGWICWITKGEELSENRGNDTSMPQFNPDIKLLLSKILESIHTWNNNFLIQYWAPKFIDNKLVLSTSEQPFVLGYLRKGLCWYRKHCLQHLYYIGDGAKEEEFGSPGRVFRSCRPESSNDPRLYSRRKFPLRDSLVGSGATSYLALPLFGLFDKQCVGVLELVGLNPYNWNQLRGIQKVFSTHTSRPTSFPIAQGEKQAFSEIEEMLTLVSGSPQLQTTLVWSCTERAPFSFTNSDDFYNPKLVEFIEACKFHRSQITKGVIGHIIESESKLWFCKDLCSSSICEQPLAYYVQAARLDICFAICLKSWYTGSSLYVIEFFLSPHSTKEYLRTLRFLLSTMKQMLKSFKVASGKLLAEELIFEVRELWHEMEHPLSKNVVHFESDVVRSSTYIVDVSRNITGFNTADQLTMKQFGGQCNLPPGFENVQYGHETEQKYSKKRIQFSGMDDARNIDHEQERNINVESINVEDEAQNITDVHFEEGKERDRGSTGFHLSYEELKTQFGKSRKDAAKNLGVSISTFKRKCRDYGIKRWPSRMNNINNSSLFRTKVANKCVENADHPKSKPSGCDLATVDFPVPPIQKTTELANTCQVADVVIKAKFKDETWKFEFCASLGVEKLMEEVGKRLNLEIEEFKLKYEDEDDGDLISLTCDEDLHLYVKSMKLKGKTTVQVLVHLISK